MKSYTSKFSTTPLLYETTPAHLSKTVVTIVNTIKKGTGYHFQYMQKDALVPTATDKSKFLLSIWAPQAEVQFFFGTQYGEQLKRVDIYPKSKVPFSIYPAAGSDLESHIKRIVDAIKGEDVSDDEDLTTKKVIAPKIQQAPALSSAQQQLAQWDIDETNLQESIDSLRREVNYMIRGSLALLVTGTGGIGKTHNVKEILTDQLGEEGEKWKIFSGGSYSAVQFYKTLYDYSSQDHQKGFILVFDDVLDDMFKNSEARNLLKGALQTKLSDRKVTWGKEMGGNYPSEFTNKGKMIIISNKPAEVLMKDDPALGTRFNVVNFDISQEQVVSYIENLLDKLNPEIDGEIRELDLDDKKDIFSWFKEWGVHMKSFKRNGYLSIRSLLSCFEYFYLSNGKDIWKKEALSKGK